MAELTAIMVVLYAWMILGMHFFHNPILTMVIYFSVICLGGGLIVRRKVNHSGRPERKPSSILIAFFITLSLSVISLLFLSEFTSILSSSGYLDHDTLVNGLAANGINRASFPLITFIFLVLNPIAEEFFWRSSVYNYLRSSIQPIYAVHLSNLLFAGWHPIVTMSFLGVWRWDVFILLFLGGWTFTKLYHYSGKIILPYFLHLTINLAVMGIAKSYLSSSTP
jgi:membrane protease YdiL (CAAX protease family)